MAVKSTNPKISALEIGHWLTCSVKKGKGGLYLHEMGIPSNLRLFKNSYLNHDGDLPSSDDPRWSDWCHPLLQYIKAKDCTWEDLRVWRKANNMSAAFLQNAISWLSMQRAVDWNGRIWTAVSIHVQQDRLKEEAEEFEITKYLTLTAQPNAWSSFDEFGSSTDDEKTTTTTVNVNENSDSTGDLKQT